jgi:hypothetical protein
MHKANSLSRRNYLNFIRLISCEVNMRAVVKEMLDLAYGAGNVSDLVCSSQMGVPYPRVYAQCLCNDTFEVPKDFLKSLSGVWSVVSCVQSAHEFICLYQVHLREVLDEKQAPVCSMTIQFNKCFATMMNTSPEFLQQAISEAQDLSFRFPNPPFWIIHPEHWDIIMEFVLFSFFNQSNLLRGSFKMASWNQEDFNNGTMSRSPIIANVIAHSSHDQLDSSISFTLGFRPVFLLGEDLTNPT